MIEGYRCVCCALPKSLVRHLANQSSGSDREALHAQIDHASRLRGQRAAHSVQRPTGPVGKQPLHRQVFDAQGGTSLPGNLLR
ncbi:MAG TPA: hypothetical protein VKD22_07805, partial [Ramlibacter sp.]|nr:hypothetical protein [Ramlibacter sp.]